MANPSRYTTTIHYRTRTGGTDDTNSSSDLTGNYEIDNSQLIEVSVAEQYAEEADDQDERPVIWERPNRRLATVNRAGRTNYPRKAASSWG